MREVRLFKYSTEPPDMILLLRSLDCKGSYSWVLGLTGQAQDLHSHIQEHRRLHFRCPAERLITSQHHGNCGVAASNIRRDDAGRNPP